MSARSRGSCQGHFDTSITPREQKRFPLSHQHENPEFLQVCLKKPSACRTGADGCGSSLKITDRREVAVRSRRPFFDRAHLRQSVCAMAHCLPTCACSTVRKQRLDYREHGFPKAEKKHKLYILSSDPASAKGRRSKEMVSHKYRTVDSIQRSGVSNASSLENKKGIELSEIKSRRSSRINKDEVDEVSTPPEINGVGPSPSIGSHRKRSLCSNESSPEDWTQEHLREPRKIEKRKSLVELQATEGAPLVSWTKKSRRRLRKGENVVLEERVRCPHSVERSAGPEEATRKSLSSSEGLKLDVASDCEGNEQLCSKLSSDSQRGFDPIDNTQLSTGNGSVQHIKDIVQASKGETGKRQLIEVTSTLCSSVAAERLLNAGMNNCLQPSLNGSNRVKASDNDNDISCSPHDHSDFGKPLCGHELSITFLSPSKEGECLPISKEKESLETLVACDLLSKEENVAMCTNEGEVRLNLAEGRRCGLCGGDSRGEPPKYLLPVSTKQRDGQNTDRISPGYSEWDAFGNEPGWLGPLLGPLDDRFGIAGVWVHQECAIWSPEVYFAGVGHIKNIRAALRRGKQLKCTRCTRPGATIGCRIERCPRTYHLPCARFDGCFFDHKKFLMACDEHLHQFLPRLPGHRHRRNSLNLGRIRFKRKVGEWKKTAQSAAQLDTEAEEKWQEKAGVDEEFLRRERKRFQRDITRVAPVMVGGTGEENMPEGWESIAGSDNVVQCMKEMVILPLLYPEAFERLGVSPPRGVLLHGHPGTGKTLAVKALVGACAKGHKRIAYFARKGADCLGKYAGDAERQLRMLFHLAEKHQPSIIFFDEIDGLAPTRSQHQDQTQKSVVSTLLALMDGIKSRGSVVVIGATNRPDALDPALRRPGRFDREIYFPLPSLVDRTAILTLLTKSWQLPLKDDTISLLASRTIGFAGADLQALCAQAAINSLTRCISVEDLMALVEKKGVSELPPLPELTVSLTDWASALEQVSPPCSWRSAKASVNTVICAPVPRHILPVLLWPMVELLVSLHLDDRALLPPILDKVATSLDVTLKSNLGGSGIDYIDFFLHDTMSSSSRNKLEQDLENLFSMAGMVSYQNVTLVTPNIAYAGSKFRVMVSGKDRSWLDHLAAWLLFGFEGFVEMCNLNLTTMLQEGGGDIVQGLIDILGNVRNKSPCVVYMPQMESWAVEPVAKNSEKERVVEQRQASHYWNIFLQQVNLLPASLQIVFMASSEMGKDDVPCEIVDFFWGTPITSSSANTYNASGKSSSQETWLSMNRSAPCSWVESYVAPDIKTVFNRAADDFAELLCQRLLSHSKSGNRTCAREPPKSGKQVVFADEQQVPHERSPSSGCKDNEHDQAVGRYDNAERPIISTANLNDTGFNAIVQEQFTPANCSEIRSATAPRVQPNPLHPPEQNHMSVAISMVGYQLLYHPELKELRHATSKLQDGPSFTTQIHTRKTSSELTDSSNSQSDHVNSLDLKGLNAVGLLAYSGTYLKAKDVAWGVREVLELLMKRIDMKVQLGKDREQFSHLLRQAASLEDKIFTWAYSLRRCDVVPSKTGDTVEETIPTEWKVGGEFEAPAVETLTVHENEIKPLNTTRNISSPKATNIIEGFSGSEVSASVLDMGNTRKSEISVLHRNSSRSDELQRDSRHIEGSENHKSQSTDVKVNEVMVEVYSVASSARKCCSDSLHQAKQALRRSFMNSWRCRGSEFSLNVADEVIGTCCSAISAAVNCVLSSDTQGVLYSTTSACNSGCLCRAKHKQPIIAPILASNDSSRKGESLTTTEPVDPDKCSLLSFDYVCLCPIIKLIFDLKW